MTKTYNFYKLPIWVTEFAPQNLLSSNDTGDINKFKQSEVNTFI